MVHENFQHTKPRIIIGTIGHSDHGKTTLTAAILQVQSELGLAKAISYADIAKGGEVCNETKTITIRSAEVEYESQNRYYAHIDCPGHPGYTKNMFDGLVQMDAAILVVSALDSVMPQTLEHVLLARRAAGISRVVVFLNKCDAVDDSNALDLVEMEIRSLLNKYGMNGDDVPVIRGSALAALQRNLRWEQTIRELMEAIDNYIPTMEHAIDKPFLMDIADVFPIKKGGVLTKGWIKQGKIAGGELVELIGIKDKQMATVGSIETFGKSLDIGFAGDLVTCLLRGPDLKDINRDQVLAKPGSVMPYTKFQAEVYLLKKEEGGGYVPFSTGYRPQFFIGTIDVTGVVILSEGMEMVMPGDTTTITIELIAPIYMKEGMPFAIRDANQTIGTGVVTKIMW